jgi:hypothetical protein
VIPHWLLPEVWGVSQDLLSEYMNFDDNDCVVIGKRLWLMSVECWLNSFLLVI